MRKLLSEESTGFKTETGKLKFLVVFFVLTFEVFPQVPVNGFCRYQQFDVDPDFTNLFPLNYNNDSYTDFILYNPLKKKVYTIEGSQNSTFGQHHLHSILLQMSDVQSLRDTNQNITGYSFISRKQASAGILKINNDGLPEVESLIKFNSYPENLSCADINGDGIQELLISGGTFNGLSIIYNENKLREVSVTGKTSYSKAVFADLNNDGYPDIAAYEIFKHSLQFFYNNSKGEFSKVRELSVNNQIVQLHSGDIDIDSYTDLIIAAGSEINIYYGDFSSSYSNILNIPTRFSVDKFITGDFNRDGKIDIAYSNFSEGTLSLIFAKDNRKFFPELIYIQKDSLTDITPYYSKFVDGISLLSVKGKIFLISNLVSFSDSVSIVAGAWPSAIFWFDKDNNGINDLCFIDNYNQTLNLLIRNNSGTPELWFPIPLFQGESAIEVYNKNPMDKTFYCYTQDKKLIEVLEVDLKKNIFKRNSYYIPGSIKDLRIRRGSGDAYVAFIKNQSLGVTVISADQQNYSYYSIKDIRRNVIDACLSVNSNPEVYFAAVENEALIIGGKFLQGTKMQEKNTGLKSDYNVTLFANSGSAVYGFFTSSENTNQLVYYSEDAYIISGKNITIPGLRIINKNQLFYGELRLNSPELCLYDDNQQIIYAFNVKDRKIYRDIIADHIFTRSFFIKNMNTQAFHLAYINNLENCITFKELK